MSCNDLEWPPAHAEWRYSFIPEDNYYVDVHKFRITNFLSFNAAPPQEHDLPQLVDKFQTKCLTHCFHNWHYYNLEHRYDSGNVEIYVDPTVYIITLTNMIHDGERGHDHTKAHDHKVVYEYEHNVYVFSPYMIDTVVDIKSNSLIKCMTKQGGSSKLYHLHGHTHSLVLNHAASKEKKRAPCFGMTIHKDHK